jgi:hypothetical protein
MTDVGDLTVRIKADTSSLQAEMKSAEAAVVETASGMESALEALKDQFMELVPAISIAALAEFSKGALEAADDLYIMAQRTGIAAETLSALSIPLKQNGSSVDEFSASMKFMSRNIELASQGNQELIAKFDDLGLSVTQLKTLSPQDQFLAISMALGQVTDQGRLTADTMGLFGRAGEGLIPIIKETNGNLQEFIDTQKQLGNTLTNDEVAKVHEYEDSWIQFIEHLKIKVVEGITAFDDLLDAGKRLGESLPSLTDRSAEGIDHFGNKMLSDGTETRAEKDARLGTTSTARFGPFYTEQFGPPIRNKDAKGNNDDLKEAADDTADATEQLAPYIQSLKDEVEALGKSQLALEVYKAQKEAASKAVNDFNNGLRDSSELTDDEKDSIALSVDELYIQKSAIKDVNDEHQKQIQVVAQMEAQISSSLADAGTNYKNFGTTVTSVLQQIAKEILELEITQPLVKNIAGGLQGLFPGAAGSNETISPELAAADPSLSNPTSGGFFSGLGFASGGSPPVGMASIVGENGPELFVPGQQGTIIPNSGIGGQSVVVNQTFNMQPGLAETVGAAIRQSAPSIAAAAHASVFQAMQKGGSESRIAGLRS